MLSVVFIAKTGSFTKDGILNWLTANLSTIQQRDGKDKVTAHTRVAEKVNGEYEAAILATKLAVGGDLSEPDETLFIAYGDEFGIGDLPPEVNFFVQDLHCTDRVRYHSHHGDINCMSFRVKSSGVVSYLSAYAYGDKTFNKG